MSGLVPKLRFKQYDDSDFPEWEEKRLGDIGKLQSGVGFSDAEQGGSEGTAFYKVSDMNLRGNETQMQSANNYVSSEQISRLKYKPIKSKAIIFAKVGAAIFLERKRLAENFLIDNNMMSFSPSQRLNICFAMHLFQKLRLAKYAQVGALPSFNSSDVAIIKIQLPSLPEQQKIADFLSSVDAKIDAVKRKHDAFERYKKGLMQQIFTQKIRFKQDDGSDFPEWEEKRLGDVAAVKTGSRDTQNRISNGKYPFFVRSDTIERIDTYAYDGEAILTSGDGVGVGKNIHYINGKFDYHQRVYAIYQFTQRLDGKFLYHYFKEHFYQRVIRLSAKNSVDSVRMSMITDMSIPLPTLNEQKKIAAFLSSIDAKIDAIKAQVEKLEAFKKGLLQQMFV